MSNTLRKDLAEYTETLRPLTEDLPHSPQMQGSLAALGSVLADLDEMLERHKED